MARGREPRLAAVKRRRKALAIFLADGYGWFMPKSDLATGSSPRSIAIADLNGDEGLEIVTANNFDDTSSVLMSRSGWDRHFESGVAGGAFSDTGPDSVAIGDLNGDGRPDLVAAGRGANNVWVLLNPTESLSAPAEPPVAKFALGRMAPNPSHGTTRINYAVAREARCG